MSEMVERGAKAIQAHMRARGCDCLFLDDEVYMQGIMRAAILAMRQPTEEMTAAGQKVNNLCEEPGHFEFLSRDEIDGIWHAMVDEALK